MNIMNFFYIFLLVIIIIIIVLILYSRRVEKLTLAPGLMNNYYSLTTQSSSEPYPLFLSTGSHVETENVGVCGSLLYGVSLSSSTPVEFRPALLDNNRRLDCSLVLNWAYNNSGVSPIGLNLRLHDGDKVIFDSRSYNLYPGLCLGLTQTYINFTADSLPDNKKHFFQLYSNDNNIGTCILVKSIDFLYY